jgi:hypothetical protein
MWMMMMMNWTAVRDADSVVETHPLRCKYVYTAIDK